MELDVTHMVEQADEMIELSGSQVEHGQNAGAYTWSTATYPATAGTAGKILRSDGTNQLSSTATFADTYAASTLLYSNGADTVAGLATCNGGVTNTSATGVPSCVQSPVLDGQAARKYSMARHTTANTAGNDLTVQSGGATSAATDKDGGPLVLAPGLSTGTGRNIVKIQAAEPATATGTGDNTLLDRLVINGYKALVNNTVTTITNMTLANNTVAAVQIHYAAQVFDGTDVQVEEGLIMCHVTNKAATIANNTCVKPATATQQAATAGTVTVTFTITAANPALVQVNVNSSLTPSAGYPKLTYNISNLTGQAMAANQ